MIVSERNKMAANIRQHFQGHLPDTKFSYIASNLAGFFLLTCQDWLIVSNSCLATNRQQLITLTNDGIIIYVLLGSHQIRCDTLAGYN